MRYAGRLAIFTILCWLAAFPVRAADTVLGTGFSYQGQLRTSGALVSATCDFQFSLWDQSSSGIQKGATQTVTGVAVTGGLFTTTVNSGNQFGASAFVGQARWLAIGVRCPTNVGSYIPLLPRTALGVNPFASYPKSTALVAFAQVPASLTTQAAAYTAFGAPQPITVPVSQQYVIHFGATLFADSTTTMGGGACVTVAVDAALPGGGACLNQSTGGGFMTTHQAETGVYFIDAGAHTLQFYGLTDANCTVSAPWFFVLRP
jgi:hypothetical protein